jgi:insertion element IS1 protein InsB
VLRWIWKKKLIPLKLTLPSARPDDVIEYDEMWSFVLDKKNKQWLWTVVLRRTKHVISYHIGKRDHIAFWKLYNKVPSEYKKCKSRSDFWEAYDNLPKALHKKCGKEEGETSQVDAVDNVMRQRLGRLVTKIH